MLLKSEVSHEKKSDQSSHQSEHGVDTQQAKASDETLAGQQPCRMPTAPIMDGCSMRGIEGGEFRQRGFDIENAFSGSAAGADDTQGPVPVPTSLDNMQR